MTIIITSDIHHNKKGLDEIINNYKYDLFIDAGDTCLSKYELNDILTVKGNCDLYHYPKDRIIKLDEKNKIFITHGNNDNFNTLKYKALENNCNIVVFGHTHIPYNKKVDDILFLNPGSITHPRKGSKPSFIILELNDKLDIKFINIG